MDRRSLVGVGLVVASAVGYASGTILAGPIYANGVDWLTLVGWRFLIGAALGWIWVLSSPRRRSAARRMSSRQVLAALALGTLFTGNAGTYYAGLQTVPAALASVVVYTYPVMVAILSLRLASPLPGRRPWVAGALGVVGSALALGGIDVSVVPPVGGLVLVILSAVIYSVWIILSARLFGERRGRSVGSFAETTPRATDSAATTAVMMTATGTVFAIGTVLAGRPLDPATVPPAAWPGIIGVGVVASFLAIQTFYAGAQRIGAARAALTSTVEPLAIVVAAWVLLDQRLAPVQLVGGACIAAGVIIVQTAPRPRGAPEPATPMDAEVGS